VCSCFGVGRNAIAACARALGHAASPAEIGKRIKCGTNCGSCVPEIQVIIADMARAAGAPRTAESK
jgi:assimilatory nitrate reductase catalytic subunit